MEWVIYGLVVLAIGGLFSTIAQSWVFFEAARIPGAGRIMFLSLLSLKSWITALLLYIVLVRTPLRPSDLSRDLIATILVVLLLVQAAGVNVAFWRWRHPSRQQLAAGVGDSRPHGGWSWQTPWRYDNAHTREVEAGAKEYTVQEAVDTMEATRINALREAERLAAQQDAARDKGGIPDDD